MLPTTSAPTLAIFCKVVDNYGDIGICWRLARQLQAEHGVAVTLWVDDLASFRRLCPAVDAQAEVQLVSGVLVRHWHGQPGPFGPADIADIVIEFFACDIPEAYIAAMAQCQPRPVWLNLEGLTAEAWVEGCHTLPSTHPRLKLVKHFFFPGFTDKTGGLLCEAGLEQARAAFQGDSAQRTLFLRSLGVPEAEQDHTLVSLFCYPDAPVASLFAQWMQGSAPITCLVPHGVAGAAVGQFLQAPPQVGQAATRGALTVRVIDFVSQPDYDKLLWSCDLNFVRGEDSFVRAQWAARPFIWHIYPQDENLHHKKLRAFLARYGQADTAALALAWNGATPVPDWHALWTACQRAMPAMAPHCEAWQRSMGRHGDLAGNLLRFAAAIGPTSTKSQV
ncbi:elongation factor P maturation arginine rhamnosyltransferase EarP [Massilia sp. PAMC28688]|uniref:elongation factor P maturation arginine rhamnosyltransferase EarP n=1 Tax=Massilia sp. PAMC28688 TaxID=2861283 RepID=UPI001C628949|nr:elongation factor P maturation arginine rhamnosyltransferase EarP [Massilia sp. PAMC28688]QYF92510.1 elongation factor P maturation arginine rhamnosyltransferase EarP [Massilia sp. PAMC28688]